MSRTDKLIERFLSKPKDFSYGELKTLLAHFGYKEDRTGKTAGSRVTFHNPVSGSVIKLHKPHPKPEFKNYQLRQVEDILIEEGLIK